MSSNFIVFPFRAVSGLFFSSPERQREKTRRNGAKGRTEAGGGWQGVRESAVSDKPLLGLWFGAKPAQSETPVRAAAKRRPPGGGRSGEKDGVAFRLTMTDRGQIFDVSTQQAHTRIRNPAGMALTANRHPCKSSVKQKHGCSGALGRARIFRMQNRSARILPLGGGSCLRRTRHPFTVSGPKAVTED